MSKVIRTQLCDDCEGIVYENKEHICEGSDMIHAIAFLECGNMQGNGFMSMKDCQQLLLDFAKNSLTPKQVYRVEVLLAASKYARTMNKSIDHNGNIV